MLYIRHGLVKGTLDIMSAAVMKIAGTALSRGSILRIGASGVLQELAAKTSGQILVGDGTDVASVAVSGDATLASTGALTIAADAVDNAMLANITRGSVKVGGASDAPTDLAAKTSGQILVGDGTDILSVAVSGDATLAASGAVTIASAPTIVSKVVGFADVAALGAVANGQVDFAAAIPAGAIPVGAWIAKGTDFSGGTLSAVTASVGIGSGDVDRYTTAEDVFTGAGAGNLFAGGVAFNGTEAMHPEGAITPSVNFVCTTDTCDGATAGSLTAYLAYVVPKT